MNDGEKIRISGTEREAILSQFGEECMICGVDVTDSAQLDHCHSTGEWRGVLCRNCNTGLGLFQDNQAYLLKAVLYLQRTASTTKEIKVK